MQKLSPAWLRVQLQGVGRAFYFRDFQQSSQPSIVSKFLATASVVLVVLISLFVVGQLPEDTGLSRLRGGFERSIPLAALIVTLFYCLPVLKIWSNLAVSRAFLTVVILGSLGLYANLSGVGIFLTFLHLVALLCLVALSFICSRRLNPSGRVAIHTLISIFAFFSSELMNIVIKWVGSSATVPVFYSSFHQVLFSSIFLMHEVARLRPNVNFKIAVSHVFSPGMLIAAIPVPVDLLPEFSKNQERRLLNVQAEALLSFLQGTLAMTFAASLMLWRNSVTDSFWLVRGWWTYLVYLFFWLGLTRLGYSVARLLGYDLAPPTNYAILASDPLERWKRWNLYYYDWFLTYIFLPISRKTRSPLFAVLIVFALNFILHNQAWVTQGLFSRTFLNSQNSILLRNEFVFYVLQGLSVYVGFIFRKTWPSDSQIAGWWGVLLTHFLMAACHSFI